MGVRYQFRTKLLLLFLSIILLTLVSIGFIHYWNLKKEVEKRARVNVEHIMQLQINAIESSMVNTENAAWRLSYDKSVQNYMTQLAHPPAELSSQLDRRIQFEQQRSQIGRFRFLDFNGNGKSFGTTLFVRSEVDEIRDAESIRIMSEMDDKKNHWRIASSSHSIPRELLFIKPVFVVSNFKPAVNVGILQVDLKADWIVNNLKDLKKRNIGEFYIANADGQVLLAADSAGMKRTHVLAEAEDGLVMHSRFTMTDWYLVAEIDKTILLEGSRKAMWQSITAVGVIFLLAIGITVAFSNKITRPILQLRQAMRRMEHGVFDVTVPVHSKDELGYLGASFNRMTEKINILILEKYQVELAGKEAQWNALQAQINPHFLFNTLSSIESLAISGKDPDKISKIIHCLSDMFRYSISAGKYGQIDEELDHIRNYLYIQKIRFGNYLSYMIDIEEQLAGMPMIKLLLQPLVENAIIHGIEKKQDGGYVSVQVFSLSDDAYAIEIEDNGAGMEAAELQKLLRKLGTAEEIEAAGRRSIGLRNVVQRLSLHYGGKAEFHMTSAIQFGTVIRLTIPKREG
jgi:two-component system sensor histidine kinase YesM